MGRTPRRRFLAAVGIAALAGCSGRGDSVGRETTTEDETPAETSTDEPAADGSSAVPTAEERLPLPMSPPKLRDQVMSGGPPKDGIPSIDDPKFVAPETVDYLDPGDPVFGVVRDGTVKAYPQKILVHHEIVNDDLAGTPVSVTYCPLTGTVLGFERGNTTFGVSGRLLNSNLVMYDRETEAWWPQILATAIPGKWNENPEIRSLREFRLVWTTWERWRNHHPETQVLSTDTGHAKNYNHDPYGSYDPPGGYYASERLMFPALPSDNPYDNKTVVMGARTAEGAVAFRKDDFREDHLLTGKIGPMPVLAVYDPRFDTAYIYTNPDEANFEFDDGSVVASNGTHYEPDEAPLARVHTFDAMSFAWAGFYRYE